MISFRKYIILLLFLLFSFSQNVSSQNSYGWERIFNSIYGINDFYLSQQNSNNFKTWLVRINGDLFGTGNYEVIKYNESSNSWHVACNSMLRAVYYHYWISSYGIEGWNIPFAFAVSPLDTNFILLNSYQAEPIGAPPQYIKFYYSFDNGLSKNEIAPFVGYKFNSLVINPQNDSINYVAKANIIYKSTNRGTSWTLSDSISFFNGKLNINPINTNYIYGIDDSLFISSDGGNNFSFVLNKKFTQIIFKFSDSTLLATYKNQLYKSLDFGFSWNIIDSLSDSINVLESDPDNENVIYAGTNRGLYRSTNAGANFYLFNNSFSPSKKVIGLCKEANRNFIYVVTEEAVYKCWNTFVIGIKELSNIIPKSFYLYQNFPNPFNPRTTINYKLSTSGNVKIKVFDLLGNEVTTLINQKQNAGTYSIEFDAANYASGVYLYRLEVDGNVIDARRMILLK